jgi:hypothetical protein
MEEFKKKGYYTNEDGTKSNAVSDSKNPAYPKKPLAGFMMFSKLFGNELCEKTGRKVEMKERGKLVKAAFDKQTTDQKKKLEKAMKEDTARFEK